MGLSFIKVLIEAVAVVVLVIGAPNAMAFQVYWTPYRSSAGGLKQYHLFLGRTYPSSVGRSTKLINQFWSNHIDSGVVCHPIKESDIPSTNDSILDAGNFVVSSKLNASDASACVAIEYRHMYSCWSGRIESKNPYVTKIYYDMDRLIYGDVYAYDACLNDNHLKEGTKTWTSV